MGSGRSFAGFASITAGLWLIDSAYKNRAPVQTARDVLTNPNSALTKDGRIAKAVPTQTPQLISHGAAQPYGAATGDRAVVVNYARAQIGKPYVFAASGPNSFDCSGLVLAAYKQVGISLPHFVGMQAAMCKKTSQPQPGDIVFFGTSLHHDGIYAGNGQLIHAPEPGDVVKLSKIWNELHWFGSLL
jgi:cell wall-associated NlpC family hydrolase